MKLNVYRGDTNTGILKPTNEIISIKPRRWVDGDGKSHPMKYVSSIAFENKNVFFLHSSGDDSKLPHHGKHISLTFWQKQLFLLMQNSHWIQKEENVRYIINILFLIGGLTIGLLNYSK